MVCLPHLTLGPEKHIYSLTTDSQRNKGPLLDSGRSISQKLVACNWQLLAWSIANTTTLLLLPYNKKQTSELAYFISVLKVSVRAYDKQQHYYISRPTKNNNFPDYIVLVATNWVPYEVTIQDFCQTKVIQSNMYYIHTSFK